MHSTWRVCGKRSNGRTETTFQPLAQRYFTSRAWVSGARLFDSVNGIEVSAEAARKAAENATLNHLLNCRFIAGSAESIFKKLPVEGHESAVIVDPPRKGCDEAFLEQLHAFGPRRIVYVSCAPDTQARDVKYLCAKGWKVVSVRPFDLFPQTRHVECIAALERA